MRTAPPVLSARRSFSRRSSQRRSHRSATSASCTNAPPPAQMPPVAPSSRTRTCFPATDGRAIEAPDRGSKRPGCKSEWQRRWLASEASRRPGTFRPCRSSKKRSIDASAAAPAGSNIARDNVESQLLEVGARPGIDARGEQILDEIRKREGHRGSRRRNIRHRASCSPCFTTSALASMPSRRSRESWSPR